jgi:putative hemolysin
VAESDLLHLAVVALLLTGSAFFSASETAFFSLSFLRIRQLQARPGGRGEKVAKLLARPRSLITTILIGNEFINVTSSSLVGAWLMERLGEGGRWWAVALMSGLVLVFGEIVPKTLAVTHPAGFALAAAPLLGFFSRVTAFPAWAIGLVTGRIVRGFGVREEGDLVTEDEFKSLVREGSRIGALDRDEEDLIYNILELSDTPVAAFMIPRTEVFSLEEGATLEEAFEAIRSPGRSRIPVVRGGLDEIVGILYAKDLLVTRARGGVEPGATVAGVARKPFVVPETMRADELLVRFRRRRVHLAVVVDEYGGTAGIVTMDDLLRRMFEEVTRGEATGGEHARKVGAGAWAVSGRMPLDDFNALFGTIFEGDGFGTVAGLVLHLFGRLPRRGEVLRSGAFLFRVTEVEGNRVTGVRVEIPAGAEKGP